ncbi:hypothetical protein EVB91_096 [Rhizobium phage RHph_I1_18]|nr:hypothetical protein EVB91_096 [Rhizobium phage RHph_I1_18]
MATKTKTKYVSKGIHSNVSRKRKVKGRTKMDRFINQWEAFLAGRNVVFTIANPDPTQTNRKYIRINGKELYGDFRKYRTKFYV